jgi:hypothetical protein
MVMNNIALLKGIAFLKKELHLLVVEVKHQSSVCLREYVCKTVHSVQTKHV